MPGYRALRPAVILIMMSGGRSSPPLNLGIDSDLIRSCHDCGLHGIGCAFDGRGRADHGARGTLLNGRGGLIDCDRSFLDGAVRRLSHAACSAPSRAANFTSYPTRSAGNFSRHLTRAASQFSGRPALAYFGSYRALACSSFGLLGADLATDSCLLCCHCLTPLLDLRKADRPNATAACSRASRKMVQNSSGVSARLEFSAQQYPHSGATAPEEKCSDRMAPPGGLEPPTWGLTVPRSTD
jgi:hypothetical protein